MVIPLEYTLLLQTNYSHNSKNMSTLQLSLFQSIHSGPLVVKPKEDADDALAQWVWNSLEECDISSMFTKEQDWVQIVKRLDVARFGSVLFPSAKHENGFKATILFCIANILYDDAFEGKIILDSFRYKDALLNPCLYDSEDQRQVLNPFMQLLARIGHTWKEIQMPEALLFEFATIMVEYSESFMEETRLLQERTTHPGVSEYMAWRKKSSGGKLGPLMAESAYEMYLPNLWRNNPLIQRLHELYNLIYIYQNDYISFKSGRDEGRLNLVFALQKEFHASRETALKQVFQFHEDAVLEIHQVMDEIGSTANGNSEILAYIQHTNEILIGTSVYHERSARFKQ
jgi:hypothetical protein